MDEVKRYRVGTGREAEDGEVVRYESYVKLEAEVKRIIEALKDSATVHSNILTGRIALTKEQAIHIAGLPADIEQQLAELDWKPITPENPPKVGDQVFDSVSYYAALVVEENKNTDWLAAGFDLFRPVNLPMATGKEREDGKQ